MTAEILNEFDLQYLQTWTEPDAERRRASIERLWAADGRMVISSIGETVEGVDAIAAHVARVREATIIERDLRFAYDQRVEAGDALLLRSSVLAPDGSVVGRGADVVFRDADGLVRTVYMFMGID
jgi:hypothetical protein